MSSIKPEDFTTLEARVQTLEDAFFGGGPPAVVARLTQLEEDLNQLDLRSSRTMQEFDHKLRETIRIVAKLRDLVANVNTTRVPLRG